METINTTHEAFIDMDEITIVNMLRAVDHGDKLLFTGEVSLDEVREFILEAAEGNGMAALSITDAIGGILVKRLRDKE